MRLNEVKIEQGNVKGHNYVAIRLARRMRMLASTILNGGLGEGDSVLMFQVPMHYDHKDPIAHMKEMLLELSLPPDTICFMTAADLQDRKSVV